MSPAAAARDRPEERQLPDILDAATDVFWETGPDHRFTRFAELSRADVDGIAAAFQHAIGRTRWDIARTDVATDPHWVAHKADLDAHRPFKNFRYCLNGHGGRRWHLSVRGWPVFNRAGAFLGYRGTVTDESSIVAALERAHDAETLLRDAVDSISEGFVIYDRDDRLVMCNDVYRRFYPDAAPVMVPGTRFEDVVRGALALGRYAGIADPEEWVAERMRLHRAARPVEQYLGNGRWALVSDQRMANGGIAGLRIDISRLKAVEAALVAREEELHRSQAHLNEAQRLGGIGSYERRVDGSWMWSREMYRIFALDPETFVLTDETQLALIHPDDRAELLSARRRVITEGGPHEAEYRIVRADGETRTVYNRVVTLHDPAGAIVGTFGTIQDVTDIRRVERQLVQAQKMEAIGNLTGGVAHDFNNLLTVILGNAELLSSSVTGADAELVQECALAARRGAELASSLLSFARRQVLRPAALDVNDLVGQAVSLMRRTLGEDIAIDVQLPAGTPCVVADAAQLESALLNLAINARDAMPGGGRLTLTVGEIALDAAAAARREIAAGTYVEIALTDTGAGMSSEIAAKAFEPFFTTKGVGKGSGLGLSMVYGFAKQSGGHAAIDSALGRGTVVRLLLPAARRRQPAGEATPRAGVPPRGRGEIVLVVEDNELVRHMVVRQIERLGYRVEAAVDAASALDKLRAQPVDLIFTDIVMPGGSGFDLAAEAARAQPGVRILFTSGYSDHAVNARGRFGAGARLIAKPYDVRELARHLREMLDTPR